MSKGVIITDILSALQKRVSVLEHSIGKPQISLQGEAQNNPVHNWNPDKELDLFFTLLKQVRDTSHGFYNFDVNRHDLLITGTETFMMTPYGKNSKQFFFKFTAEPFERSKLGQVPRLSRRSGSPTYGILMHLEHTNMPSRSDNDVFVYDSARNIIANLTSWIESVHPRQGWRRICGLIAQYVDDYTFQTFADGSEMIKGRAVFKNSNAYDYEIADISKWGKHPFRLNIFKTFRSGSTTVMHESGNVEYIGEILRKLTKTDWDPFNY